MLDLPDDDPDAVDSMLCFMYTGCVSRKALDSFVASARIFAIAEKYCISKLEHVALQNFESCTIGEMNTIDFANAIRSVYSSTTDSQHAMRNAITSIIAENATELYKDHLKLGSNRAYNHFLEASSSIPQVATRVNAELLDQIRRTTRPYYCASVDLNNVDAAGNPFGCRMRFNACMEEGKSYYRSCPCGDAITMPPEEWADFICRPDIAEFGVSEDPED